MSAARKLDLVSVDDYLAGELVSTDKHEYVGGIIYAMAGARNVYNTINGNMFAAIHTRLRGKQCRPFNSDTKVRIQLRTHIRFYYPDASIVCDQNPGEDSYQDRPVVIFEVLSRRTRRIDEGEKKDAYLTLPSLAAYVLIEQDTAAAVVFRRNENGFAREVHEGLDAVIPLQAVEIDLPLGEIYKGMEFTPESDDDV